MRRRGCEDIAAVEHAGDGLHHDLGGDDGDGTLGSSVRSPGQRQDPVIGSDQLAARAGLDGDRQPIRADSRVDDREADRVGRGEAKAFGEHQTARLDVVRSDAVRDVDHRRTRRDPGDDGVTDTHELISQTKVRDEYDRLAHDATHLTWDDRATVRRGGRRDKGDPNARVTVAR